MPIVARVTIRNIDRLVVFSTARSWASGIMLAAGIGAIACSFVLYTIDIRMASFVFGSRKGLEKGRYEAGAGDIAVPMRIVCGS